MALSTELRGEFLFAGHVGELANLPDVVGERLFEVNVFATLEGPVTGVKVRVVRGGNHHCIDLLVHLVQHHAEIIKKRLVCSPVLHVFRAEVAVHIAECDEVFVLASLFVWLPGDPPARADEGDIQLFIRGLSRLADGE